MLSLLVFVVIVVWVLLYQRTIDDIGNEMPSKMSLRLDKLWSIAQESMRNDRYLRAEKALLTILRVDERNSTAYNRLGILYAKQRAYKDAIECFEIAQSLEPSSSSLHNVGLIYYETGVYDKAALAFEQALHMEGNLAARHIAYAKVQEKLGDNKKMLSALEKAVELEPNPQSLAILAEAYEKIGQNELANDIREKSKALIVPEGVPKRIQKPPHRVIM
ncbi:tetratricopeptide repeat protein [Candidatus Saccharibacteria bacterium]|nr:tetratricopeptide repeat protein [Candidatus Saccharibacteria bacterium]NCU40651.1 tetratricopeptide repeat protein [Candidatus Saccharibacteria bacterium]